MRAGHRIDVGGCRSIKHQTLGRLVRGVLLLLVVLANPVQSAWADGRVSALACLNLPIDRTELALTKIDRYQTACIPELRARFKKPDLSDRFYELVLATVVAHYAVPYGKGNGRDLTSLLANESLACAGYAKLATLLGNGGEARFVGFEGGAVGNHAQMLISIDGHDILLDPTIGAIAFVSYDDLMSGKSAEVHSFFSGDPTLTRFNAKVLSALREGKYRPSDLLYYYENFEQFSSPSGYQFPTPGGARLRNRKPVPRPSDPAETSTRSTAIQSEPD